MDNSLLQWVQEVRKAGWKDDQIRHALEQKGWQEKDIQELLGEQHVLSSQSASPAQVRSKPWILIILASVAIVAIILVVVLYLIRK